MRIFDAVCLKQTRVAIDLIIFFRLDSLAKEIGLELVERENGALQLMQQSSYRRVGRRMRQSDPGKVIA